MTANPLRGSATPRAASSTGADVRQDVACLSSSRLWGGFGEPTPSRIVAGRRERDRAQPAASDLLFRPVSSPISPRPSAMWR